MCVNDIKKMTDETDIKLASKITLSVSKDKDLELSSDERQLLIKTSKLLGECC